MTLGLLSVKNKWLLIALAGVLLIFTIFAGCAFQDPQIRHSNVPLIKKGILDLTDWNLSLDGKIVLSGESEFYWSRFIPYEEFLGAEKPVSAFMDFPGTWKGKSLEGKKLPGLGFATYRFRILLGEEETRSLALMIYAQDTAYKLYINGHLTARAGVPGRDKTDSSPKWRSQLVEIKNPGEELDILIHISNFHHARGGLGGRILLGTEALLVEHLERAAAAKFFVSGALLMIALYHGVIFLLRRKDRSTLYFSLFCFLMTLRNLVIEEYFLEHLAPWISWQLLVRLTYLSFSLGLPLMMLFVYSLYPEEFKKIFLGIFITAGGLYTLIILLSPPRFFTNLVLPFQIIIILCSLYGLYIFLAAMVRKKRDALFFFLVFVLFFLCIVNDTLHHNQVINTTYIVPTGFIAFLFLQSVILSKRSSEAFVKAETLFIEKIKLEGTALTLKNLSYLDSLTGISNRRGFDEYLTQEWNKAQERKNPLGMIMIDIDFFKQYNDLYGHRRGDEVLQLVASTLEATVCRAGDVVCRFGGEEFAVILPDTDLEGTRALAENLRKRIAEQNIRHEGSKISDHLTISLGCSSIIPEDAMKPEKLIEISDHALYRSKNNGRNQTN